MIVYKSQGQPIEDKDVVRVQHHYGTMDYIVVYNMHSCSYLLYPLGGHSIGTQNLQILDDIEWEYLGYILDEGCYTQLNIQGGIPAYLEAIDKVRLF